MLLEAAQNLTNCDKPKQQSYKNVILDHQSSRAFTHDQEDPKRPKFYESLYISCCKVLLGYYDFGGFQVVEFKLLHLRFFKIFSSTLPNLSDVVLKVNVANILEVYDKGS